MTVHFGFPLVVSLVAALRLPAGPRQLVGCALLAALSGCGGSSAEVTGTALGINFADVQHVYFGGPYIVLTTTEDVDCEGVAFVRQSYEEGVAPTTEAVELVQFTYVNGAVAEGNKSIAQTDAEVTSLVMATDGEQMDYDRATAGAISVDSLVDEQSVTGSFDTVTFADGTISGDFSAEWCRNLRDR
jgi:hypothetical protein